MKRKRIRCLAACLAAALMFSAAPERPVHAAQVQDAQTAPGTEATQEEDPLNDNSNEATTAVPELPESYHWPIQTNEISGWPQGPQVQAETAIVMDAGSGAVLYGKNADDARYPASITKIMTTILAIEHSALDEQVTFSENAIWGIERDSTHIGIQIGETLTMEQCLYAMMLASANEVCIGVAEHIAGSVETFAQMMNEKAAEIGCTNTHFANPHGLHDDNHYTTARDMALISQYALKNDLFRQVTGSTYYIIPPTNITAEERWLGNHQKMLLDSQYHYDGCIGGKTGYTSIAGNTLVTYAQQGDLELICVVMKDNGAGSYTDSAALLDYGFHSFQKVVLTPAGGINSKWLPPFDRQFFQGVPVSRMGVTLSDAYAVIPAEAGQESVTASLTAEKGIRNTIYTFNGQPVGSSQSRIYRVLPNRPFIQKGLSQTITTKEIISQADEVNASDIATSFAQLPSWKYPVAGILILAAVFYLISFILHLRRKARIKKLKKKDEELQASLSEHYEPFLTEERILDEDLLRKISGEETKEET